jgi:hypothetical protein
MPPKVTEISGRSRKKTKDARSGGAAAGPQTPAAFAGESAQNERGEVWRKMAACNKKTLAAHFAGGSAGENNKKIRLKASCFHIPRACLSLPSKSTIVPEHTHIHALCVCTALGCVYACVDANVIIQLKVIASALH